MTAAAKWNGPPIPGVDVDSLPLVSGRPGERVTLRGPSRVLASELNAGFVVVPNGWMMFVVDEAR